MAARSIRRAGIAALLATFALVSTGCGKTGAPVPPAPRGPLNPGNVVARQVGERLIVLFDVPSPRGKKPAQRPVRAQLVRLEYAPGRPAPYDLGAFRRRSTQVGELEGSAIEPGRRVRFTDSATDLGGADLTGWTLRYGVRVLDRRGRSSPLVVAKDLVPVKPPPSPSDLAGEATADGVRLTWTAPTDEESPRFNIYRGPDDGQIAELPLNATPVGSSEYLDTEVVAGSTYLYEVRTLAAEEPPLRESAPSPVSRILAEDRFAPARPGGLVAVQERLAVRLFWNPNDERDLAGYRVYRRELPDGAWDRIGPETVAEPLYLDERVTVGTSYSYRVTAIDRATPPNESGSSETAELTPAAEPTGEDGETP
jgi:hypothetical protein